MILLSRWRHFILAKFTLPSDSIYKEFLNVGTQSVILGFSFSERRWFPEKVMRFTNRMRELDEVN